MTVTTTPTQITPRRMDNVTRPTVSSVQPGIVMDFTRHRNPNYFSTAARASVGTWFDSNGILRDAAINEMRYEADIRGLYWNNYASSKMSRWNTALNNVRSGTGNAVIYAIGDSTTRGDGPFNYLNAFRTQFPDVPVRADGFSGNGQAPISAISTITEFSGAWTNSLADATFFSTVGGWLFKHPGSAAGNFTVTPSVPASHMRLWFYGYFTGSGAVRVSANGATRADIDTNLYNNQYTFIDVALGATSTNPVTMTWLSGGPLWIGGVEFYNSSKAEVRIINAGWYGGTSDELAFDNGRPNAPVTAAQLVNADLVILGCGINDAAQSKTIANFNTKMQALITSIEVAGSSIVCVGQNPASPTNINFVNELRTIAGNNNLPFVDLFNKWGGSLAAAQAAGLVSGDNIHPTAAGYVDKGNTLAKFVQGSLTLPRRGLLIESQRTNLIRNNTATGAVAGSPGTLPTFTGVFAVPAGLTRTISTGTEYGMAYYDVRYVGTPATTGGFGLTFEGNNTIATTQNTQLTLSVFIRLQAGSLTNISSTQLVMNEFDSTPTFLTGGQTNITPSPLLTRFSFTRTMSNAAVAFVNPFFQINVTSGQPVDFTFRFYSAQLEVGAFASSVIRTSTASATRSPDNIVVNNLNNIAFNPSEGAMYGEYELYGMTTIVQRVAFFDDGTNNNRMSIATSSVVGNAGLTVRSATVDQVGLLQSGITANTIIKHAAGYKVDDYAVSVNGSTPITDTSGLLALNLSNLRLGQEVGASNHLNGWLRSFVYYPVRLSNAQLQAMTL